VAEVKSSQNNETLSTGKIIGVVIAAVAVLVFMSCVGVFLYRRYGRNEIPKPETSGINSNHPSILLKTEKFTSGKRKKVFVLAITEAFEMENAVKKFIHVLNSLLYCQVVRIDREYIAQYCQKTGLLISLWSFNNLEDGDIVIVQPDIDIDAEGYSPNNYNESLLQSCLCYLSSSNNNEICSRTYIVRFDGFRLQSMFRTPIVNLKEFVIPNFLANFFNLLHSTDLNEEEFQAFYRSEIEDLRTAVSLVTQRSTVATASSPNSNGNGYSNYVSTV